MSQLPIGIHEQRTAELEREARRKLEEETATTHRRLLAAGWPERALSYAKRLPERQTAALLATQLWASMPGHPTKPRRCILVLSGNSGAGKTVAAAWWARHVRIGKETGFLRATEIPKMSSARLDAILTAPALLLDDLGTEKLDRRGKVVDFYAELVEVFYADQKPLVITTMRDEDELSVLPDKGGRFSGHAFGRLREAGCLRNVPGENLRDRMGEEDETCETISNDSDGR